MTGFAMIHARDEERHQDLLSPYLINNYTSIRKITGKDYCVANTLSESY